ncbi:pre-mRNA-processing protein 40C-like isoform X1 [Musa acuminata AAA Group]|uniref:pre-mRNA-processing protein 40C-like isoform X1 n=2 Tax=Musa acuminata AAA Group TaxID=214697 RepID=UPI0031E0705D
MSATARPLQETQNTVPTSVPNSESMDSSIGGSASGTPTSAVAVIASPVQGAATFSSTSDSVPSNVVVSATLTGSSLLSIGGLVKAHDTSQDSIRAKFSSPPGFVVAAPSFSYGVIPRTNLTSGNPQQSSSSVSFYIGLKLTPPVPAAALQPPVPGQFLGTRPFPYNVVSHANVVPAAGQQIQLNTVPVQAHLQGGKFIPPSASSLQPPVPRQPVRPTPFGPGAVSLISPSPMQFPLSVPQGDAIKQTNFSFSGHNQFSTAEKDETILSSEKCTSDAVAVETTSDSSTLVNSQSVQTSQSMPLGTSTGLGINANACAASMLIPAAPSFTAHAEMPNARGIPGLTGNSSSATASTGATIKPTPTNSSISSPRPIIPVTAALPPTSTSVPVPFPVPQNVQQQTNVHYSSQPTMAPSPQASWSHPPQAGPMQHVSFSPYPGFFPAPFSLPVQGIPPAVPLPFIQPPGVSLMVSQVEPTAVTAGSLQPGSSMVAESSSSVVDQDKKSNNLDKDEGDTSNELENAWTAHKTETGAVYYYNSITGKSTYQKPSNFKGESEKATTQSNAVSWEKLAGTDWTIVTTSDGRKYYYDTKNKVSSWHVPAEVAELRKNQESGSTEGSATQLQDASTQGDKVSTPANIAAPAAQIGAHDSMALRSSGAPVSSSALDMVKKKLQEAGTPMTSPHSTSVPATSDANGLKATEAVAKGVINKDKSKDANGEGNMSDSSSESDDEESGPSKEECIIQFKEMLKERGVAPFSKWDKELPKIVFDPRFKAVPSQSARRALFEHYVRTRAEEERKEKRAAQKAALDAFKQLLEEALEDIDHKTDYHSFKRKWGGDPRFEGIDRKERELLLNEKVKAADEKMRALRMAAATSFKSMLRDNRDITTSSRWSRIKESLRDDPRYKAVKHEQRETLFIEYIAELKSAVDEVERSAKAKRDEQDKLKERERELRKRKEREEKEMERVKLKVRRKEAEYSYRTLLVEMIKDPKASWTESKPKLEKDPQGRATNPDLTQEDAEKLFREHVKDLYERCVNDFRTLLAEVVTVEAAAAKNDDGKTVLNSWSEAKLLLKPDPRYSKMPSKDRESLWRRHTEDMLRRPKSVSDTKESPGTNGRNRMSSAADPLKRSPGRSHRRR